MLDTQIVPFQSPIEDSFFSDSERCGRQGLRKRFNPLSRIRSSLTRPLTTL